MQNIWFTSRRKRPHRFSLLLVFLVFLCIPLPLWVLVCSFIHSGFCAYPLLWVFVCLFVYSGYLCAPLPFPVWSVCPFVSSFWIVLCPPNPSNFGRFSSQFLIWYNRGGRLLVSKGCQTSERAMIERPEILVYLNFNFTTFIYFLDVWYCQL